MAVEISQRVLDMVRHELVQNPDVDNATLFEKAKRLDPQAMRDIDRRQFNARYPLRVKRFEMQSRRPKPAREKRPRTRPRRQAAGAENATAAAASKAGAGAKDSVREVFLRFAQDLAKAETRGEIVGVIAGVDQYVDRILGLAAFKG